MTHGSNYILYTIILKIIFLLILNYYAKISLTTLRKGKVLSMDFFQEIKDHVLWDFRLENEFKGERRHGYAFVVDVCDGTPRLAIYMIKERLSKTQTLLEKHQPPREMLVRAVEEEGGNLNRDCLYNINAEIRDWLEENLFS